MLLSAVVSRMYSTRTNPSPSFRLTAAIRFIFVYVFGSLGTFDQSAAGIEEHLADRKILIAYREKLFVLLKFENCGKVCRLSPARSGFGNIFKRAALSMHHAT